MSEKKITKRCVGISWRNKQCENMTSTFCKHCGKPVCYFHGGKDKHECVKNE